MSGDSDFRMGPPAARFLAAIAVFALFAASGAIGTELLIGGGLWLSLLAQRPGR
jgi:hypothetical protein